MQLNYDILEQLREKFGEAFYLLDTIQFKQNYRELKETFSDIYPNFNIAYSYKTNYTPAFCKIVDELGGYAEVVSEMELELALKIGVLPSRIIWNGPIKNEKTMEEFLLLGGTVNLDSMEELTFVQNLAEKYPKNIFNIGIRCNYDVGDGVISRFGFDIDGSEFKQCFLLLQKIKNVNLINFQCHFAKRQIDYWPARVNGMLALIEKTGVVPDRIDLGGGLFGKMDHDLKKQFPYEVPEYKEYASVAAKLFHQYFDKKSKKPELLIEPGSALVGDCMCFVGTVKTMKRIRNKMFATVMGSQKNISMAGVNPPIKIYSNKKGKFYENVDLVGFTCIESDILYKDYSGRLMIGDFVVISNCGSYSLVMKPPFILPNFPVIDISDGKERLIKRAESFEDVFHTFLF